VVTGTTDDTGVGWLETEVDTGCWTAVWCDEAHPLSAEAASVKVAKTTRAPAPPPPVPRFTVATVSNR
jgi:hypothetical protein